MSDLLPCPFCPDGGDVQTPPALFGDVICRRCRASAPQSTWNRRAPAPATSDAENEPATVTHPDGCPTEKAVLERFWREHQSAPSDAEDAARYRWLRQDQEGFEVSVAETDDDGYEHWVSAYPPDELDAAIDAARGAK